MKQGAGIWLNPKTKQWAYVSKHERFLYYKQNKAKKLGVPEHVLKKISQMDVVKDENPIRIEGIKSGFVRMRDRWQHVIVQFYADLAIRDILWAIKYALNDVPEYQNAWHDLSRKIPVSYLDAIDVDYEVLEGVVELDKEEYKRALQIPLYPSGFTVRYMACVYQNVEFPPETTEYEAIEIMKEFAEEKRKSCIINSPDFKTIVAGKDGEIRTVYYEPEINIKGGYLMPSTHGRRLGKVRIA